MSGDISLNPEAPQITAWIERRRWLVAAIFALLLAVQITPKFKMSPDGVSYMSIARNMIHGRVERLGSPHLRYAPGYPLFISPAFVFGPRPFIAVQLLQWFYSMLLMAGVYAWFARYAGKSAIWVAALTMASAGYWDLYRTASSETAFSPAVVWTGYFMARSLEAHRCAATMACAVLTGAIACATRQAGAMLVGGFVSAAIMRAAAGKLSWKRAILLAVIFTVLIGAISEGLVAWQNSAGEGGYLAVFLKNRSIAGQLAEGTRRQIAEISRLVIPGMWKTHSREHQYLDINNFIYLAAFIPVTIGWWRFSRETSDPLALSIPFFLTLYVAYPYDSGTRFTVPIFAAVAGSLWYLLKNHPAKRPAIFLALIVIHTTVAIGFWADDAAHVRKRYEAWDGIAQVASEIPADATVIALRGEIDDRWMFLMCLTDRPVAPETADQPVENFVDWTVADASESVLPGFERVKFVGNYQVEKRIAGNAHPELR